MLQYLPFFLCFVISIPQEIAEYTVILHAIREIILSAYFICEFRSDIVIDKVVEVHIDRLLCILITHMALITDNPH